MKTCTRTSWSRRCTLSAAMLLMAPACGTDDETEDGAGSGDATEGADTMGADSSGEGMEEESAEGSSGGAGSGGGSGGADSTGGAGDTAGDTEGADTDGGDTEGTDTDAGDTEGADTDGGDTQGDTEAGDTEGKMVDPRDCIDIEDQEVCEATDPCEWTDEQCVPMGLGQLCNDQDTQEDCEEFEDLCLWDERNEDCSEA